VLKAVSLVFRGLLLISLPFLAWGFGRETLQTLYRTSYASPRVIAFIVGAAAFIPVWVLFWRWLREPLEFFVTMEHEFAHLLVGLLFLKAPISFTANRDGNGEVELNGCNFLIRLAPYFLPTISLLLLPVLFLVRREYALVTLGALGFSVAYHIFSTVHEARLDQPDIRSSGIAFSFAFLPVANLFVYGALFAFAVGEYAGLKHYCLKGFANSLSIALSLSGR
jgi:hypothetical protein